MESLLVTPIKPIELMLGKITPYIIISFIILALILASLPLLPDLVPSAGANRIVDEQEEDFPNDWFFGLGFAACCAINIGIIVVQILLAVWVYRDAEKRWKDALAELEAQQDALGAYVDKKTPNVYVVVEPGLICQIYYYSDSVPVRIQFHRTVKLREDETT